AFFSVAALRSKRASCNGVSRLVRSAANLPIIHIEAVLGDVPLDGRRQPIAHRLPLRDRTAEGAAGDVRGGARAQDHPHSVQAGAIDGGARGREMAEVDRIERAAEDADPHGWNSNSTPAMLTLSPGFTPAASRAALTPMRSSSD